MFGSFYLVVRFFYSQEAVCTFFKVHTASACTTSVDTYHDKTFVAHVSFEHASITEASDAPSVEYLLRTRSAVLVHDDRIFLAWIEVGRFHHPAVQLYTFGCTETEKLFFRHVQCSNFRFQFRVVQ